MAKSKFITTYNVTINGHSLHARKFPGIGWHITCISWPDLEAFSGVDDLSEVITQFEQRATAAPEPKAEG